MVQAWRVAAFERLEREGCLRGGALLPTPREDAAPGAGQGAHGRLVCLAWLAWRLSIDRCPAGMPGGCRRPRDTRWAQALWTLAAPGAPGLLAAAVGDRRHARRLLAGRSGGKAVPLGAAGDEEAGSTNGSSPWPGVTHRAVGMGLGAVCEGWGDGGTGLPGPRRGATRAGTRRT